MNKKVRTISYFIDSLIAEQLLPALTPAQKFTYNKLVAIPLHKIAAEHWNKVFALAADQKLRFASIWAEEISPIFALTVALEAGGEYLLLRTTVAIDEPKISSITPHYAGANRMERHIHDLYGIIFIGHPDPRRWTKHQAWDDQHYPLRHDFGAPTNSCSLHHFIPPDDSYPFAQITGNAVYEIPVGPVHAGIIEPGHFRFNAAGEDVISLEIRLGYTHKGIEQLAVGKDGFGLARLAARISGDATVGHTWAACMAMENALGVAVPSRALFLRALMLERERVANHLGDFAAICNDVGFSFAYYQLTRLKEIVLRINQQVFGHRLIMDQIIPGGVNIDLDNNQVAALQQQNIWLRKELDAIYSIIQNNSSAHDRLKNTGILSFSDATNLGAVGIVGRASGINFDLRHHAPHAPYDQLQVPVPIYNSGDVLSRTRIRAQEILVALNLLNELLTKLPESPIKTTWPQTTATAAENNFAGIGLVESWRGEILTYVRMDESGKVARFFPRDPSWFSWPALELLIHDNIVPDFPVCNKSINGSYSGVDL